jgi:hypothetical protein
MFFIVVILYLPTVRQIELNMFDWGGVVLFCFTVLGLELRAYTLSHSPSPIFVRVFLFEIGSYKLFPAGFEL